MPELSYFAIKKSYPLTPALIKKVYDAKKANAKQIVAWGTGKATREFLYVDDLASACVFLMNNYSGSETVNVGSGIEVTIKELAEAIKEAIGFKGEVVFDPSKPDGTPRKLLNTSKLTSMGWLAKTGLGEGIKSAYEDFLKRKC